MGDRVISDGDLLEQALDGLAPLDVISLDTEFHWERSYHPLLAVVQLGGRMPDGRIAACAIDALAVDLDPLVEFLSEPRLKVVHAGRIDLQIFARLAEQPLQPVFDTQIGAALLGYGYQVGYANLVESLTGKKLGKAHQYSDWTRRPLSSAQVDYALQDVTHLLDVHATLESLLEQTGRHAWAKEEMAPLIEPDSYVEPGPREAYKKVKAHRSLDRRSLAILRELAAWREREAKKRDLRPGFILKDPVLLDLSRRPPKTRQALEKVRGMHGGLVRRAGNQMLEAIKRGQKTDDLPEQPKRRKKVDVGGAVELLKAYVAQRAAAANVASEVVATTSELESLARGHARGDELDGRPVLSGWRGELVGKALLKILDGEVTLGLDPETSELRLVERE